MELAHVQAVLAAHRTELTELGVRSLYVFGSVARGEAGPDSDVDLLVELARPMGLFPFLSIRYRLEELLGGKVDLVVADGLKPRIRRQVLREAIRAA